MKHLKYNHSFEQCAFIMFRTTMPNYSMAAHLNKLLAIDFKKLTTPEPSEQDTAIEADNYTDPLYSLPLFFYDSFIERMQYCLVDVSKTEEYSCPLEALSYYNYVLILTNGQCYKKMDSIYTSMQNIESPVDEHDYLSQSIVEQWREFASNIEDFNYFDFRDAEVPSSSQWGIIELPLKQTFKRTINGLRKALVALFETVQMRLST